MSKKPRPWFRVALTGPRAARFQFFDEIGYREPAQAFFDAVEKLGPLDDVEMRISSNGGDVRVGNSVLSYLLKMPAKITALVETAASIASVFAMAADHIRIVKNGWFMVHGAAFSPVSRITAEEAENLADFLKTINTNFLSAYRRHVSVPDAELRKMFLKDTWISAERAVQMGFAHEIVDATTFHAFSDLSVHASAPAAALALHTSQEETTMRIETGEKPDQSTPETAAATEETQPSAEQGQEAAPATEAPASVPEAAPQPAPPSEPAPATVQNSTLTATLGNTDWAAMFAPMIAAQVEAATAAATKPLEDELTALRADRTAQEEAAVKARVEAFWKSGRIPRNEVEHETKLLLSASAEDREARFKMFEARQPSMMALMEPLEVSGPDGETTTRVELNAGDFAPPGVSVEPKYMAVIAKARAEAGDDPEAYEEALLKAYDSGGLAQ